MKPLITIVTVVLNGYNEIENTILSVLNQTYTNTEYIVIDGGSTDNTIEIIRKYSNSLSYWVSEPDNGVYDAMNKSISNANGDWIIFMNCGDTFANNDVLMDVFSNFKDKGQSLICGDVIYKYSDGALIKYKVTDRAKENRYMPTCHQSIFTRLAEIKKCGYNTKYQLIADFEFYYDLYQRNSSYEMIDLTVSIFDASGLSTNVLQRKKEMVELYFNKKKYFFSLIYFLKFLNTLLFKKEL